MDCNEGLNVDLHIHSNASDGTLTPGEILETAKKLCLGAIAITDHDTIEGSKQAADIGIPTGMGFLTGIEISAAPLPGFPYSGSFHILGYCFRLDEPVLNDTLSVLQKARKDRNPKIVKRLGELGFDISWDEVGDAFPGTQIGRPHIARIMIEKGYASSISDAFDKYLGNDRPAYVDKERIECIHAIKIIKEAGGIPVLAHPALLRPFREVSQDRLISELKEYGLMGIEVYYPGHSPDQTAFYHEIASRYDLLMTGGTDFHGAIKPDTCMGSGKGDFSVPYSIYEELSRHCG